MSADDEALAGDAEFDPAVEPEKSAAWLNLLKDAETVFNDYQGRADNIDRLYADLKQLAENSRERQFQLFWANIQVLAPSIYGRPPVPVVVPRFKDRKPVPRAASELLERASVVTFETEDIDQVMRLVRDDLTIQARGVAWLRLEEENGVQRVCIEHIDRKDFRHDPARKWKEVGWVGRGAWLDLDDAKARFEPTSGDAYKNAAYAVRKDDKDTGGRDPVAKACFWEIWSKTENRVVWVTDGVEDLLDQGKPHLTLEGFFPCPMPAYGTVQRRSLVPVPDIIFYKDQLEEINELTGRISALAEGLRLRGFYPAGAGEIGDAIEAAIKSTGNNQILIGISNWSMFGGGAAKDMIVWLPLDMVAKTVTELVSLRKQLIDDVYQITGLSDIMRGSTEASETATAQQLKAQYGSVRIRDRQAELVRIARDICRLAAEIMAENFSPATLLAMAQIELPTDADIAKQVKALEGEGRQIIEMAQKAQSDPKVAQMAQQNPDQAKQIVSQAEEKLAGLKQQIDGLKAQPTIDAVMKLLREQRIRPFVLDIETDSTIQPDEDAEKKRRAEFLTALGGTLQQLAALIQAKPEAGPFAAQVLKFAVAPFRAGRELEQAIDEFAEKLSEQAKQPQPNPEAMKLQGDMQLAQAKDQRETAAATLKAKIETGLAEQTVQLAERKNRMEIEAIRQRAANDQQAHQQAMELGAIAIAKGKAELIALTAPKPAEQTPAKPPSESIAFKDLPPEGQSQMAEQAGIHLTPAAMAAHTATQDAKAAATAAAKAKPAPA